MFKDICDDVREIVQTIKRDYAQAEVWALALVCLFWTWGVGGFYLKLQLGEVLSLGREEREYFFPLVFTLSLLPFVGYVLKKVQFWDYVFLFAFLYCVFSARNNLYFQERSHWILVAFPLYYLGLLVKIDACLVKSIFIATLAGCLNVIFLATTFPSLFVGHGGDRMSTAYHLFPLVMTLGCFMVLRKKIWCLAAFVLLYSFLLGMGNRGTALTSLLYVSAMFTFSVFQRKETFVRKMRNLCFLAVLVVVFTLIVNYLGYYFQDNDLYSSRVLDRFDANSFLDSKSRDALVERSWTFINRAPFSGYGFLGDEQLLGTYPHKIYLELWLQFGLVLGSIILGCLAFLFFRGLTITFSKSKEINYFAWCLVFCQLTLFLSGTYSTSPAFFFTTGFMVNLIRGENARLQEDLSGDSRRQIKKATPALFFTKGFMANLVRRRNVRLQTDLLRFNRRRIQTDLLRFKRRRIRTETPALFFTKGFMANLIRRRNARLQTDLLRFNRKRKR